jgi:flavin-dependent dehydrogenase
MAGPRIAIVGGGIGGLVLALALRERGIRCEVYEQADELREIGAHVHDAQAAHRAAAASPTRAPKEENRHADRHRSGAVRQPRAVRARRDRAREPSADA